MTSEYELPLDGSLQYQNQQDLNMPSGSMGVGTQPYEVPADAMQKARTLASPPRPANTDYETPWDAKTL